MTVPQRILAGVIPLLLMLAVLRVGGAPFDAMFGPISWVGVVVGIGLGLSAVGFAVPDALLEEDDHR